MVSGIMLLETIEEGFCLVVSFMNEDGYFMTWILLLTRLFDKSLNKLWWPVDVSKGLESTDFSVGGLRG